MKNIIYKIKKGAETDGVFLKEEECKELVSYLQEINFNHMIFEEATKDMLNLLDTAKHIVSNLDERIKRCQIV